MTILDLILRVYSTQTVDIFHVLHLFSIYHNMYCLYHDFTVSRPNCAHETNQETQSTDLTDDLDVIECLSVNKTTTFLEWI
jgi:hypothetical protein